MKKRTARSGFKNTKDVELLNLAGTVMQAMDGNAYFPTPRPDLITLSTGYENYRLALERASRKGSPLDNSLKRDAKAELVAILKQLAFYVNTEADGDLSMILSSGFPLAGEPTNLRPPGIPERLRLLDYLQAGQLNLMFDSVTDAWMYEVAVSAEKDAQGVIHWETPFTTRKSRGNILAPLEVGTRYYVRVRAINGAGVSDWSEPVSQIAR